MTAINDLVTMAGETALAKPELALPFAMLADLEATMRDLYGSVFDALEGVMGIQPVIIPYTVPAGPMELKESPPAKEAEKKPATLGQIDIRTLISDLQSAISREIPVPSPTRAAVKAEGLARGKDRPESRKTTSSSVTTEAFNVHTITKEIQKHIESLEKETISLPKVYSSFYGNVGGGAITADRSFAVEYARASPLGSLANDVKTIEAPDKKHVADAGHMRPPAPVKVKARAAPGPSPPVDEGVRRSTTAVKALETVYENLVKNSVSLESIDREIKTSPVGRLADQRPTATVRPSIESRPARAKTIEVPALKVRSQVPSPSAQAEDNAKSLSEAFSKSVSASAAHMQDVKVERSPAPASPSSALATVSHSFSVMGGYMGAVADMARPIDVMANASARSPVVNLALERAMGNPDSKPSPINVLMRMGGTMRAPIPEMLRHVSAGDAGSMRLPVVELLGRVEGKRDPAVNFAVNLAASDEMQRAGGSVIQQFIKSGPSFSSGLGGAASAVAAERNSIINISSPAAAGNTTDNSTVNKVSNFHNTFNITISAKGGGEEGSLRELGKKIGKILSDEMKRYGGI